MKNMAVGKTGTTANSMALDKRIIGNAIISIGRPKVNLF